MIPRPEPRDYQTAERYLLQVMAVHDMYDGRPAGVSPKDFDAAVKAVAEWTARMRRLADAQAALTGEDWVAKMSQVAEERSAREGEG